MNHNLRIPSADDQDSFSILQGKISHRLSVSFDKLGDSSLFAQLFIKDTTPNSPFARGCTGALDNDDWTLGRLKTYNELRIGASDMWFPVNTEPGRVGVVSVTGFRRAGEPRIAEDTCTGTFLHRLVINSNRKPMWEYDSDEQLLKAFRDVVQAHLRLCENGIPYHNISPGNMLLSIDPTAESQGILTDIEFASSTDPTLFFPSSTRKVVGDSQTRAYVVSDSKHDVKRGSITTGTVQFMARELLLEQTENHQRKHDIESFIWSFSFCVWWKLYCLVRPAADSDSDDISDDDYEKKRFLTNFWSIFSQTDPDRIAAQRQSGSIALTFALDRRFKNIVRRFMTEPLVKLFRALVLMMERAQTVDSTIRIPLTHEILLGAIEAAIEGHGRGLNPLD